MVAGKRGASIRCFFTRYFWGLGVNTIRLQTIRCRLASVRVENHRVRMGFFDSFRIIRLIPRAKHHSLKSGLERSMGSFERFLVN